MKIVVEKGIGRPAEFRLHDGINTVGRDLSNRIRVMDLGVSRKHCKIRKIGSSLFLLDLGTKNGTQVNGSRVKTQELRVGDRVKVGRTVLLVTEDDYIPPNPLLASTPLSFLRRVSQLLSGKAELADSAASEFPLFFRRRRKAFWRLPVDTDPPEAECETVISHSDPGVE
jgi:pSer/pThr/pTyr-binding forkhead associated (FHA) protein